MLSTFHVSLRMVDKIHELSLLLSQYLLRIAGENYLSENYSPYIHIFPNFSVCGCFPSIICYPVISPYFRMWLSFSQDIGLIDIYIYI